MAINIIIYSAIVIGFITGIRLMQSPGTALRGNRLGAICMAAAIFFVFSELKLFADYMVWIYIIAGGVIGVIFSQKIKMIQMPQVVALLNGLGGGASAIIAVVTMYAGPDENGLLFWLTAAIALGIGAITFTGSMVAALKLQGWAFKRPLFIKGHKIILYTLLTSGVSLIVLMIFYQELYIIYILLFIFSLCGILMTIRIGGADMPVIISFLNSFSGVAASISGLAVGNALLVGVGSLVGVAGMILTNIMCKSMNRSLVAVLSGFKNNRASDQNNKNEESLSQIKNKSLSEGKIPSIFKKARKVIIVPGYGMALAQAQMYIKQLLDILEKDNKDVKIAIHPVAGRMPGHMNVLLAEAGIDYAKLYDMDKINPEFPSTDVVICVGACDVINPAANTAEGTPIYGMPILKAFEAKAVIIFNLDRKPGYSGVENSLYKEENVITVWGNASETLPKIIENFKNDN